MTERPERTGKRLEGMAYICRRLGVTRQRVYRILAGDPKFPAFQYAPGGDYVVDRDALEAWLEGCKAKRFKTFRDASNGLGVHRLPDADVTKDAALDLRYVAATGTAPPHSAHWPNAKFAKGDVPADIRAAFDLAPTASFEIAVEAAARLLALPSAKRAEAFRAVAGRLAAFHSGEEV